MVNIVGVGIAGTFVSYMTDVAERPYHSPRREAQAAETHRVILEAAGRLFVERGFNAATINAIAAEAGVSAVSVYGHFQTKANLLRSWRQSLFFGLTDDERRGMQHAREQSDIERTLEIAVEWATPILVRLGPLYRVLRGAGSSDPVIAGQLTEIDELRWAGCVEWDRIFRSKPGVSPALDPSTTTTVLWSLADPGQVLTNMTERQWSIDRYRRWYLDCFRMLYLAPAPGP